MKTLIALFLGLGLAQDRPKGMPPDKAPKQGDDSPNFKLKRLGDPDPKNEVELAGFRGKRPVVLIFGSYT